MPLADRKSGIPHETETYKDKFQICDNVSTLVSLHNTPEHILSHTKCSDVASWTSGLY